MDPLLATCMDPPGATFGCFRLRVVALVSSPRKYRVKARPASDTQKTCIITHCILQASGFDSEVLWSMANAKDAHRTYMVSRNRPRATQPVGEVATWIRISLVIARFFLCLLGVAWCGTQRVCEVQSCRCHKQHSDRDLNAGQTSLYANIVVQCDILLI